MDPEKEHRLEADGYEFDKGLDCYVSRKAGKIFSKAWVEEKNLNTLVISLSLPHVPTAWKLHLNPDQPHEEMRNGLYEKFGSKP